MTDPDTWPANWNVERLHADHAQALRITTELYDSATAHQRIRVFENPTFGRVMTLDGAVQVTEADNFIYHEMLTHVPILAHGAVKRVLIVGGGDGGMAREVLKHASIEQVTMVEIDGGVVEFCKTYLPGISAGAFDDPRLDLVIADGADFMRQNADTYDVIIIDSTDPVGPAEVLFTDSFYGHAKRRLAPGGILVTQNGVPFLQPQELANTMRAFRALFADATCYLTTVPSYAGGAMALGWGTDGGARAVDLAILQARFDAAGLKTECYTPALHLAAFALPPYVARLIG
jgi:spermidine synthase